MMKKGGMSGKDENFNPNTVIEAQANQISDDSHSSASQCKYEIFDYSVYAVVLGKRKRSPPEMEAPIESTEVDRRR